MVEVALLTCSLISAIQGQIVGDCSAGVCEFHGNFQDAFPT